MPKEKLLIVEDEGIVAMDLKDRLESLNYQVVGVEASATNAIRRVGKTHPDLVLMDIMLDGEFDGIKAADYIGKHYDIPVVFLTANSDPKTLERAKAAGPFGYLLKPFQERELQTAIEMAIYRFSADKKIKESQSWLMTTLRFMGEGVIATDSETRIKFLNPAAEKLTRRKATNIMGTRFSAVFKLLDKNSLPVTDDLLARVTSDGIVVDMTGHSLAAAGQTRHVKITGSLAKIVDSLGKDHGIILVFREGLDSSKLGDQSKGQPAHAE